MASRLKQFERVGCGAMSDVFRGELLGERGANKAVAIKRMRTALNEDPCAVELFVNEAKITVRLNHPHVVQGIELGRDEQGYYLLSEWLEGCSLQELHQQCGDLEIPAMLTLGQALCDALTYLHNMVSPQGVEDAILHRDITPGNIFVTNTGGIKLMDFGVAKCVGSPDLAVCVGTEGFAAPEQARGQASMRSDLYGVGATLRAITRDPPVQLEALFDKAMAIDPKQRFKNAKELRQALIQAADVTPMPTGLLAQKISSHVPHPQKQNKSLDGAVRSILGDSDLGVHFATHTAVKIPTKPPYVKWLTGMAVLLGATVGLFLWIPQDASHQSQTPKAPRKPLLKNQVQKIQPPIKTQVTTPVKRPKVDTVWVSMNSVPWATVRFESKDLGNTPLRRIQLPVGRHDITLQHPPDGKVHRFHITIEGGAPQTFVFDLRRNLVTKRKDP